MKCFVTGIFLVATATFAGTVMAQGVCDNSYEVMAAAHDLENEAYHFADQVRYEDGYSHLAADAEAFAREAGHFNEAVESYDSCSHMESDFYAVTQEERHFRREWRYAHASRNSYHLERDFNILEAAYHDLLRAVSRGRGRGRDHGDGDGPIIIRRAM